MKRNVKIFIKRNRFHIVITAFCLWIFVKQMSSPCIFPYNDITSFLFERVSDNTVCGELLDFVYNLGFAYFSSLIFYFVIDYFPSRKKEKMALISVRDHLSAIVAYTEKLLAVLLFVYRRYSSVDTSNQNKDILNVHGLKLDNTTVRYNWEIIEEKRGSLFGGCQGDTLYPFDEVKHICKIILQEVDAINSHMNSENLEEEVRELLCNLSENRYIVNITHLDSGVLDSGSVSLVVNSGKRDILELILIRIALNDLLITQYKCTMCKTTEPELADIENSYAKMHKKMPGTMALYERITDKLKKNKQE